MIQAGAVEPGGVYRVKGLSDHEYVVNSITVLPSGLVTVEWTWIPPRELNKAFRSWTGKATEYFADLHVNYAINEDAGP